MDSFLVRFLTSLLTDLSVALLTGLLLAARWLKRVPGAPALMSFALPAGLLVLAIGLQLLSLTAAFTGRSAPLDLFSSLPDIIRTHAGGVLSLTLLAAILLLVIVVFVNSERSFAVALALLCCLFFRAGSGHAASEGVASTSQALQLIHLGSMAIWSGGILISGFFVMPGLVEHSKSFDSYLAVLSRYSTWAVSVTALSGLCKAYLAAEGSIRTSLATKWGIALTLKIACVAVALVLGYLNRRSVSSGNESTPAGRSSSVKFLRAEALAMTMILIASAVLANLPPPGE